MRSVNSALVPATASVREAIVAIDKGGYQIAVVVDSEGRLLGVVSDGDIRRAILKAVPLEAPVTSVMNPRPVATMESGAKEKLQQVLKSGLRITRIPVVDADNRVIGIQIAEDLLCADLSNHWVVLMAGGKGVRLRPLTHTIPKPMVEVGGKPIIEIILERFRDLGFRNFYIAVNYMAEVIKGHFADGEKWGVNVRYLEEREPLGTAGALRLLPETPSHPFFVMNGDLLTSLNFEQLLGYHQAHGGMATMCLRPYSFQVPYGVVDLTGNRLTGLREKPTHDYFVNAGIYVLEPEALRAIPSEGYFDMTTLFSTLIARGDAPVAFPLREEWIDIGRPEDLERACAEFAITKRSA